MLWVEVATLCFGRRNLKVSAHVPGEAPHLQTSLVQNSSSYETRNEGMNQQLAEVSPPDEAWSSDKGTVRRSHCIQMFNHMDGRGRMWGRK